MMNSTMSTDTMLPPIVRHKTPVLKRLLQIVGGLIAVAMLLFAASLFVANFMLTGLAAGTPAPTFSAPDLNGNLLRLTEYAGQPVMVTFWSPDCFACREELPALQAIASDPNANVTLLTVVSKVPAAEVQAFVAAEGLTFPVIVDEAGAIAQDYQISGVPVSYFINPDGKVDHNVIGAGGEGALTNNLFTWLSTCNLDEVCK